MRIVPHVFWPDGGTGVVSMPPDSIRSAFSGRVSFDSPQRVVAGEESLEIQIWVKFDTPIQDGEGDGPYTEGEVGFEYLEKIETSELADSEAI